MASILFLHHANVKASKISNLENYQTCINVSSLSSKIQNDANRRETVGGIVAYRRLVVVLKGSKNERSRETI